MGYRIWWQIALVLALTAMALTSTATTAWAQEPLDKVRQANTAYDGGDFKEALRLYREAYDELDDERLLYRIGLSYENIGNYAEGRRYLERYLQEDPDSPVRGRVEASINQLRELEGAIQAYLSVETEPSGVDIYLHGYLGEPAAVSPATIPVGAGNNEVTLVFEEGQRLEVNVNVPAGTTEERFFSIGTAVAPDETPDEAADDDELAAAEDSGDGSEAGDAADEVDEAVDAAEDEAEQAARDQGSDDDVIPSPEASADSQRPIRMDYVDAGPPWWASTLAVIGIVGGQLMLANTIFLEVDEGNAPWVGGLSLWALGTGGGMYLLGRKWRGRLPSIDDDASASAPPRGSLPAGRAKMLFQWQTTF